MHIPYKEIQLIDVNLINKRELEYQYNYWGMTNEFHEVLNLVRNPYKDQLNGIGVLEEGSMAFEGATGLDEYSKNVINTGFNARGVIESEKIMSKPSRQSLTAMLKRFFSGGKNAVKGSLLIVNEARRKMNWNYLKGMDRPIVMRGNMYYK